MPLIMLDLQMGQVGTSPNEKSSLIQHVHPSLLHVQIEVSSSGIGSICFLEKWMIMTSLKFYEVKLLRKHRLRFCGASHDGAEETVPSSRFESISLF